MQRRSIVVVALIPLIGVVLLPVLVDVATDQLPTSWDGYLWLAWPFAALLAGVVTTAEIRRYRQAPVLAADRVQLDRAADDIADAMESQWRAEAAVRSLNQPAPIQVGWELTDHVAAAPPTAVLRGPTSPASRRLDTAGSLDDIAIALRRQPDQQLVVLGPPAAGKSSLAVVLTLYLLARRSSTDRVPVLLTLSGWDPRVEHLDSWMARRLIEEHPALDNLEHYGTGSALSLVTKGRVLPLLDGLDEMPTSLRATAIAAVNEAVAGGRPLVLTCRTDEYQAAVRTSGAVLPAALVLEIAPVEPTAAVDYLSSAGMVDNRRWEPVFEHLRANPDGALAAALSTPLMVWLARIIYQPPATDPAKLLRFGDRQTVEDHLLDSFLPTAYAPRALAPTAAPVRHYPPEKAIAWLTYLASHLHSHDSRELEQLSRPVDERS